MRTRESHAVCLSALITLLVVAPAFAFEPETQYTNFANVYNMDNPPGWNSSTHWSEYNYGGGTPTWDNSTDGFLKHSNTDSNQYYLQQQIGVVGASDTWTVEFKAKINDHGDDAGTSITAPAGLYIGIMNTSDELIEVVMQKNAIQMRNSSGTWVPIDSGNNQSGYTQLRIVRSGADVRIFRNGSTTLLGGQEYTTNPNTPGHDYEPTDDFIMFGDAAYYPDDDVDFEMDYIAFDTAHAYVPEPATLMVLASGLAVCLLAKRR